MTPSSGGKLARAKARAKALGVDRLIFHHTPDCHAEVLHLMESVGIDVIFENGAAPSTVQCLHCMRFSSLVDVIGCISGHVGYQQMAIDALWRCPRRMRAKDPSMD